MSNGPPPLRRQSSRVWIAAIAGAVLLCCAIGVIVIVVVARSGITRPIDNVFGDQHLKTVVALKDKGHAMRTRNHIGVANCIEVDPKTGALIAVADVKRDGGKAAAW